MRGQRGNALFIILIAIALVAALTYTFVRTTRMTGALSQETVTLGGNAIMHYGDSMHNAVQGVLGGGTYVSKLSFSNTTITGYDNANDNGAGADTPVNMVFSTGGGGMRYEAPDAIWLDSSKSASDFYGQWYFPKNICVPYVGMGADGAGGTTLCSADSVDNEEVVMILPYVKAEICTYIDKKLGITMCSGAPCAAAVTLAPNAASDKFAGTFSDGKALYSSSGSSAYNHQYEGCIQGTGGTAGTYFYYKVLAER
jgi:hypothetical protein